MEDQYRAETAHKQLHLFGKSAEKIHDCFDAVIDRREPKREVSPQREPQQSDAVGLGMRLARNEADRIPCGFHPSRCMTNHHASIGNPLRPGTLKIMRNVDCETLR